MGLILFLALFISLLGKAAGQQPDYNIRSANFSLQLLSPNATLNGTLLTYCHVHTAWGTVCISNTTLADLSNPPPSWWPEYPGFRESFTFTQNTSQPAEQRYSNGTDGPLSMPWVVMSDDEWLDSFVSLKVGTWSNVAGTEFGPASNATGDNDRGLAFDENGYLMMYRGWDDTGEF